MLLRNLAIPIKKKKIELRRMIEEAEKVLPPATIEDLKKRAEGQLLDKVYPRKPSKRNLLLTAIAIIIVVLIALPVLNFVWSVIHKEQSGKLDSGRPSNPLNGGAGMNPIASPSVNAQLPPISLQIQPDVSVKNLDSVIKSLRVSRQLRAIAPLESGKSIEETPSGTFFYMPRGYLRHSEGELEEALKREGVETMKSVNSSFEVHKLSEDKIELIAFVSKDIAQSISRLDGKSKKEVVLSATPWEDNTTMVILPVNRLIVAKRRDITTSEGRLAPTMDAVVQ